LPKNDKKLLKLAHRKQAEDKKIVKSREPKQKSKNKKQQQKIGLQKQTKK